MMQRPFVLTFAFVRVPCVLRKRLPDAGSAPELSRCVRTAWRLPTEERDCNRRRLREGRMIAKAINREHRSFYERTLLNACNTHRCCDAGLVWSFVGQASA